MFVVLHHRLWCNGCVK